jgi:glyoxylase-like metal-dependent hydrolase (beta-lactamase superfamily II)/rhodanese-related sulfurtransferase
MFFRQILNDDLGCASYVIASAGEAAVIDPKWDVDEYLQLADEHGFEIRYVLETHNHADHVSGRGRLAATTGARIYTSPTPDLEYPHETLADGDAIEFGTVRIEALATPGHRPEHTAYVVFDRERGDDPFAVLTGDSLFVGDVARPDLAIEAQEGAAELFGSLARLLELPDHVQVCPGHIGGSLCGGARMSEAPGSTIGYERRVNPMLGITDRSRFVEAATEGLAPQPPNFRRIVDLNRGPLLANASALPRLAPTEVATILAAGGTLIDGRAPNAWMDAHVPGSLNVTIVHATVGSRAAAVVDPASPVVVTAATERVAAEVARRLEAVGFRDLRGILAGGLEAWRTGGLELASTEWITPAQLAPRLRSGEVALLDVRDPGEWDAGHVAGSLHVPLLSLAGELEELRGRFDGMPLAVACSVGNRAAVAVSVLERAGIEHLIYVADGGVEDLAHHRIELTAPVLQAAG